MATQQLGPIISIPASGDLSASQFCAMALNSSGQAALPTAGAAIFGVLQNDPDTAGEACEMQIYGVAKWKLGGTVAAGDFVKVDSSGRAVTASAGDIAAGQAMGVCSKGGAANNIGSVVVLAQSVTVSTTGLDALTAAAAASLLTETTTLDITGTVAYTLAAPLYPGQKKRVRCTAAATTPIGTLTIADTYGSEPATHVFTAAGQEIVLEGTATGWKMIGKTRVGNQAVVVGTTVLTGYDMAARYNLSVTGTVTGAAGSGFGIPGGQVNGEYIDVQVTTAATSPEGEIDIAALSIDGDAATKIDNIDGTTAHHAQLRWDGAAWQAVSITGIVLA